MGWLERGAPYLDYLALTVLIVLVLCAIIGDLRQRRISNRTNFVIVGSWLVIECIAVAFLGEPWQVPVAGIGLSFILLVTGLLLFAFSLLGGGDVKMLAAVALWLPSNGTVEGMLDSLVLFLTVMVIAGGVVSLGTLVWHRIRVDGDKRVPYGVAIGFATVWLCLQPFVSVAS